MISLEELNNKRVSVIAINYDSEVKREELYTALKKQVKEALERNKILSKTNSHLVYQLTEKYRSDSNQ